MSPRISSVGHPHQSGLSLIELMVAMVVSLILMLGLGSLLLANKDSYRTQNEFAALQQNSRLARFVIKNAIEHAGYIVDLTTDPQHAFAHGFVAVTTNEHRTYYNDTDNDSDTITIRFQSDGDMSDCQGKRVGSPGNPDTAHYELYVDDDENELECTVYNSSGGFHTEPLVDNVMLMQVRYGLDTTPGDSNRGVDMYTQTLDASNREQVRTVRVQLVLVSDSKLRNEGKTQSFDIAGYANPYKPGQLFESTDADPNAPSDPELHTYLMVDQVIALRNLLP